MTPHVRTLLIIPDTHDMLRVSFSRRGQGEIT